MVQTRTMLTLVATVALALAACGDDTGGTNKAAATTTVVETIEQFGTRINAECPGGDPGFDPFYTEHPTPTAEDYVAFLPGPIDMMSSLIDCIKASNPPTDITDDVNSVTDAMKVVVADFEAALVAAKAGDLDKVDAIISDMHDNDAPAIDAAIAAIGQSEE